jgi:hypothetical protein
MIDAFGHSQANAALFSDFGFESIFFSRISNFEREKFKKEKKMTFLWEPNSINYKGKKKILTHVTLGHYDGPLDSGHIMSPYDTIEFNLD